LPAEIEAKSRRPRSSRRPPGRRSLARRHQAE